MIFIYLMIICVSLALFVFVAYEDFRTWKIRNIYIFILIALFFAKYSVISLWGEEAPWHPGLLSSLAAGAFLFALGFALWALKLLGAGDAKLLAPIGLFLGWNNLIAYSLFLLLFAVIASIALKFPVPTIIKATQIGMRLDEIRETGKVPYGVLMVGALVATYLYKHSGVF